MLMTAPSDALWCESVSRKGDDAPRKSVVGLLVLFAHGGCETKRDELGGVSDYL